MDRNTAIAGPELSEHDWYLIALALGIAADTYKGDAVIAPDCATQFLDQSRHAREILQKIDGKFGF